MRIHKSRGLIYIALVFLGALPLIAAAVEPIQEEKDVVRDTLIRMEVSCSPGSKCFIEKEKECLKLGSADEQIRCLDDLQGN